MTGKVTLTRLSLHCRPITDCSSSSHSFSTATKAKATVTNANAKAKATLPQMPLVLRDYKTTTKATTTTVAAKATPPPPPPPQVPLFLRPPSHKTTTKELKKWQEWAKHMALSVGSTFVDSDNGPGSSLLLRELNWLLQDSASNDDGSVVALRVSLEDLYGLWRERIEKRRPFQYIVGCEHWRDLVLSVQEGVLIPRPETEMLVDLVEDVVVGGGGVWADLGTGSGAIAIGVGRVLERFGGRVIATDLSPVAVQVTGFNVRRYGLQDVVEIRQGSWYEPLKDFEGKLSGVVSNPPYIPSSNIATLQAEVGRHEPRLALDGGHNGMDFLLHICNGAAPMLKPGGFFAVETNGDEQCKFLVDYMENDMAGSFCKLNIVSDFAGIKRFVTGFRR